ncbi:MAG: PA2779 family protein [Azoarcus sp.]|nr:PA2779 family protein [Azoarcus sp.]
MKKIKRFFALLLIVSFANVTLAHTVQASLISTDQVARTVAVASGESPHAKLTEMLSRADVAAQLQKFGVSASDAQDRIAALTDEEAVLMAQQIENSPAGGGILGAVVFVFVLLLVTDLLGLTSVFPFTR